MAKGAHAITGTVEITSYTVYPDNIDADDAIFDIAPLSRLLLLGDDVLGDDAIASKGRLLSRGSLEIDDGLTLRDTANFVNAGNVTQNGGVLDLGVSSDDLVAVRNVPGGTWTMAEGAGMMGESASRFVNLGRLDVGADSTIAAKFHNRGTLDIEGKLTFQTDAPRLFGAIEGAGTLNADHALLDGASVSCADLFITRARLLGDVSISSTDVQFNGAYFADATLQIAGDNTYFQMQVALGRGQIETSGSVSQHGVSLYLEDETGLANSGAFTAAGGVYGLIDQVSADYFGLLGQCFIRNLAGASWTDSASSTTYQADAGAYFDNAGALLEDGAGTFDVAVVNDGTMHVGQSYVVYRDGPTTINPSLTFDQAITGAGTIEVDPGAITVAAPVDSSQTFAFAAAAAGAQPTLTLNDVQDFAATISGFALNGAADDALVVDTTSWTYQDFVPNSSGTGGALMFSNGGAETAVHLTGGYDAAGFHAAISGAQTTITYVAPA